MNISVELVQNLTILTCLVRGLTQNMYYTHDIYIDTRLLILSDTEQRVGENSVKIIVTTNQPISKKYIGIYK